MRLALLLVLLLAAGAPLAAECALVWVPGYWTGGTTRVWVPGRYQQQVTTTTTTTTTYTVPPPPPPVAQVWVSERWEWNGSAWELRPGYWAPAAPPAPVAVAPVTTTTRTVEVHHVDPPPRVAVSVGYGYGYGYGHGYCPPPSRTVVSRDSGHGTTVRHVDVRPPAPLPGSHALPRPPRWVPDPLGVFRHDPLHLLRRK